MRGVAAYVGEAQGEIGLFAGAAGERGGVDRLAIVRGQGVEALFLEGCAYAAPAAVGYAGEYLGCVPYDGGLAVTLEFAPRLVKQSAGKGQS